MESRSNRAEVRNPVLALPAARLLLAIPAAPRAALRMVLLHLATDASGRAQECWRKHKAPMAAYWKAVAVYARHIARALKPDAATPPALAPQWAGEFRNFDDWCNKASSRLAGQPHPTIGSEWPAICVDAKGRRCWCGADFMRARDDDAFPVRYFWDFEVQQ